ncbi:uncharacterized protein LOC100900966 [Galendromus occidentalis]|uniref:Uncharacterized protein LOC100900966 n=1 Tax=Galendromus occidentalis TaxID=34638 RepID=A0AAJ6QQD6_9ACAR|nr:uncharacterized protein LOC100900966 [Galendromus occidentalis]
MGYFDPVILPDQSRINTTENVLRVAVRKFPPFVTLSKHGSKVSVNGPLKVFLEAMASSAGVRVTVWPAGEMIHGVRLANGTFTGIMGLIEQGQVDMFVGPVIMNDERLDLAEALILDVTSYRLVTWQPSKWVDPFQFMTAFTVDVWLLILFSILLLAMICWLMERFLMRSDQGAGTPLRDVLWGVCSRALSLDPLSRDEVWLRLCLSGFLLVFPLVLMNSLSSKLISAMTIKKDEDFINKYEDVLRFPEVRIYRSEKRDIPQIESEADPNPRTICAWAQATRDDVRGGSEKKSHYLQSRNV